MKCTIKFTFEKRGANYDEVSKNYVVYHHYGPNTLKFIVQPQKKEYYISFWFLWVLSFADICTPE